MRIEVACIPIAQPRHKVAMRGRFATAYVDGKHPVHDYKVGLRKAWQAATNQAPTDVPLSVSIVGVFPRPKRLIWKKRPMPREPHTSKPDCDNFAKSTLDALNGLAWRDDSQIHSLSVRKLIAAGDEQPRVIVEVEATR